MNRVSQLANQVVGANGVAAPQGRASTKVGVKDDNDAVICCAIRTALGKSKKGSFKDTPPEELLAACYEGIVKKTGIDPALIQDAQIGNVLQGGAGAMAARIAQFMAKYPANTSAVAVNRQCSSGLQCIANVTSAIQAGHYDIGIAGGVESMSMNSMMDTINPKNLSEKIFDHEGAKNCLIPMGVTSENVAAKYSIPREKQDALALSSHVKALKAQADGLYDEEIIPVTVTIKDKKSGAEKTVTVTKDEGPRPGIQPADLAKLGPAFQKGGSTTAGNSSQTTDGAAMVLIASRKKAKELGLPVIGKMVSFAVEGCPPEIMGIGPAVAIPSALGKAGLGIKDIDIFEINEAFASQATYCVEHLGVPAEKLNPKGGAIALGHPLGATGARMCATLMPELKRTNGKLGIISMCIGSGMGAAGVFERE
mmetsp:Transcript_13314/g.32618  ORF Transcript_13314/g.32618 Transcript_13314/m.32618 type:complete len:424 (-) Transcript_13314:790-2061(-)|eukprot:CAMPEP_0178990940 /NCGR_PEP_ID=MMETSP0795-20121207/5243_1 /TAXON_ID=88552 /ORGANISM="Amoebophrya sp., Strain Ameob2" /LENGTH=423 /DNA_ID=CAMNT_0020682577 /DNA_START=237 /DNA_END=1508 /DNA_ORIENTATION=+